MSALILAYGAVGAIAQERMAPQPNQQQTQSHRTGDESTGTMGHGMMCRGMMGGGMMGRGMMGGSAMGSPMMFRMMFALMDDGDGEISLQEFQAAHERIFKATDRNKDGQLTQEEMQAFMQGTRKAVPQQ
jgi:Ca2+-binding EF-hand superfamily protein